jgi:type IV pilus assembly protein PilC
LQQRQYEARASSECPRKQLVAFTRQLSTLQDAGLPILRSLQILEQQQKPGLLKAIIGGVAEEVEGGGTLSDAMAKYPKAFDKLYVNMINAGEAGGVLDLILARLADFMEKAAKLKKKVIGAMIYPAVVISIAVGIVSMIMIVVISLSRRMYCLCANDSADVNIQLVAYELRC